MNAKQRRQYARAQRVVLFVETRADDFPEGSRGAKLLVQLKEALVTFGTLDVARTTGASKRVQGSAGRRTVREALRALLQAVFDTARIIALDHPDVDGIFSFTDAGRSDQTLITTARATATAATPFIELFVEYGLAANFVNELRSKADSLNHYISLQGEGLAGRADSNVSADETLRLITGLIERIDNAVRNKYRGDNATILAWERARRVVSAPQNQSEGVNAPPPDTNTPPADGNTPPTDGNTPPPDGNTPPPDEKK